MAKLTTHITGKVSKKLVITGEEIREMVALRYPQIPQGADMQCDTDLGPQLDLEAVFFEWSADTSTPAEETDVPPTMSVCGRRCPPASPPIKHVMIPHPQDNMGDCRPEADQVW